MRLRILIHALSLSGAGHYVRARALAGELATAHDVVLTDAGRPVPLPLPAGVRSLALERLRREAGALRGDTADVLARRREQLVLATHEHRPDVVLVEHYPFSKWALADEIEAMIAAARAVNRAVRVICSVRDFALQTRHEDCDAPTWRTRVVDTLNRRFDALLHHADPALLAFESVFHDAGRLQIPVHATGLVHRVEPDDPSQLPADLAGQRFAVCSVGGGGDGANLASAVREAWRSLRRDGGVPLDRLVVCGADSPSSEGDVIELPFVPRFDVLLRRARLSISHAGYNTCADVLRFGVPALLVPHPAMSDQAPRAALMANIGAAQTVAPGAVDAAALARAIAGTRRIASPDLEGARATRRWLEALRPPAAGSGRS